MANIGESISRAPSFQKILTESMVWPGSESHRQTELEIPAKFVQAHGDKFHMANRVCGPSCQLMTVMVKIRTKAHGQMRVIDKSPNSTPTIRNIPISSMLPPNTSRLGTSVESGTELDIMAAHAEEIHKWMVCKTSAFYTSPEFSAQEEIKVVQEQDIPWEAGSSKSLELISSMIPPYTFHPEEGAEFAGAEETMTHADDHERYDESTVCKLSTNYTSSNFSEQDDRVVTQEQDFPAETESIVENLQSGNMMRWMKRVERRIQRHQLPPPKVVQFKVQLPSSAIQHFGNDLCAHLILPGRQAWLTLPRLVSLRGPKGGLWPVQCVTYYFQSNSSVHFKAGWGAFVEENLLEVGDELGFTMTAQAHFEVSVVKKAWSSKSKRPSGRFLVS